MAYSRIRVRWAWPFGRVNVSRRWLQLPGRLRSELRLRIAFRTAAEIARRSDKTRGCR